MAFTKVTEKFSEQQGRISCRRREIKQGYRWLLLISFNHWVYASRICSNPFLLNGKRWLGENKEPYSQIKFALEQCKRGCRFLDLRGVMLRDRYSEWARGKVKTREKFSDIKKWKQPWHRKGFWTDGVYGADVYTFVWGCIGLRLYWREKERL